MDLDDYANVQSKIRNLIKSKKWFFIFVIYSCILMCVLTILIGNLNIQRVNNDIKVNTMIKDASIMKETLLSMSFGNWMLYLKDS